MLFSCIFVLAFFAASANAVNLRNGPKNVGIDLHDGAFSSGHHEGRKLQDLDRELNLEDDCGHKSCSMLKPDMARSASSTTTLEQSSQTRNTSNLNYAEVTV